MKFSTREDVDVPIDAVFEALSDFTGFERRAMRRGAEVSRVDPADGAGLGTVWEVMFDFRGKERELVAELVEFDAPTGMCVASRAGGLKGDFRVSLVALNPNKTRMSVGLELVPTNLSARLLVQSLKLAKSSLSQRFDGAVDDYARSLERSAAAGRAS